MRILSHGLNRSISLTLTQVSNQQARAFDLLTELANVPLQLLGRFAFGQGSLQFLLQNVNQLLLIGQIGLTGTLLLHLSQTLLLLLQELLGLLTAFWCVLT